MQYKNFGKYIRYKRKILGYSLNKFAVLILLDPATLSRIETQKQDVKLADIEKIANGFNKTVSELLCECEQMFNKF